MSKSVCVVKTSGRKIFMCLLGGAVWLGECCSTLYAWPARCYPYHETSGRGIPNPSKPSTRCAQPAISIMRYGDPCNVCGCFQKVWNLSCFAGSGRRVCIQFVYVYIVFFRYICIYIFYIDISKYVYIFKCDRWAIEHLRISQVGKECDPHFPPHRPKFPSGI